MRGGSTGGGCAGVIPGSVRAGGVQLSVGTAREHVESELLPRAGERSTGEEDAGPGCRRPRPSQRFENLPLLAVPPAVQQIPARASDENVESGGASPTGHGSARDRRRTLHRGIDGVPFLGRAERREGAPARAIPPLEQKVPGGPSREHAHAAVAAVARRYLSCEFESLGGIDLPGAGPTPPSDSNSLKPEPSQVAWSSAPAAPTAKTSIRP